MSENTRTMPSLTAEDVWAVLSDGQTYGHWVVGTRGTREVTPDFPAPGSVIHYAVGRGPFRKDDKTVSLSCQAPRCLELEAHAWPFGTLSIVLRLSDVDGGVTVTIEEAPKKGLLRTLHNPLIDLAIKARNVETLRRLEKQARQKASLR
jgi:hypothetical protein